MRKYILLKNESIQHNGRTLYRIQSVKAFDGVDVGDKGGYVESEDNLSQDDDCWLYNEAKSYDSAVVRGNAVMCHNSEACDYAVVEGNVSVRFNVKIGGHSYVADNVTLSGNVYISGNVSITDEVQIYGDDITISDGVCISEFATIFENVKLSGSAYINGHTNIGGNVKISGNVTLSGNSFIADDVNIFGDTIIAAEESMVGDAVISSNNDYITFLVNDPVMPHYITYTKSNNKWTYRCLFHGSSEELLMYESRFGDYAYKLVKRYIDFVQQLSKL